jgi:hypothetical protein
MKAFHLKDIKTFIPPYKEYLENLLTITNERSIDLTDGVRGFIVGRHVLAPHAYQESIIASKDGFKIVLTFEKTCNWGVTHYLLPYEIPCEPLHFRHEHIHSDTFFFRVYRHITMCSAFKVMGGKAWYGLNAPDQFCPVFDRHGHLIGMNTGVFGEHLLCIPIQLLI